MMALPFVLVVLAALVAMLGFRKISELCWFVALAAVLYAFYYHHGALGALKIAV